MLNVLEFVEELFAGSVIFVVTLQVPVPSFLQSDVPPIVIKGLLVPVALHVLSV